MGEGQLKPPVFPRVALSTFASGEKEEVICISPRPLPALRHGEDHEEGVRTPLSRGLCCLPASAPVPPVAAVSSVALPLLKSTGRSAPPWVPRIWRPGIFIAVGLIPGSAHAGK
ncbi:unnamed protein product [Lepidochelys kempii]